MAFAYKIYFSDRLGNRVVSWDPDTGDSEIVAERLSDLRLKEPYGLALDPEGRLIIADKYNNRLCRLHNKRIEKINTFDADGHRKCRFRGRQDNPLSPTGICFERGKFLLVSYCDDHCIYRVHPNGRLELLLGIPPSRHYAFSGCREHVPPEKISDTPVYMPTGIAVTKDGTVFFIERGYRTVRRYHPRTGLHSLFPHSLKEKFRKVRQAPRETDTDSYFPPYPTGLAIDDNGRILLSDGWHRCVFEIDLSSKQMKRIMQTRKARRKWRGPAALALGPDKTLWVLDAGEECIRGFKKSDSGSWNEIPATFHIETQKGSCGTTGGTGMVCGVST